MRYMCWPPLITALSLAVNCLKVIGDLHWNCRPCGNSQPFKPKLSIHYESLDSMTKIRLARKYAIPQWLLAGFEELAQRPCALNQRECRSLGLYATAGIFRVREKAHLFSFQQHTTSDVKKNAFNDSSFDYRGAIREELKSELGEYRAWTFNKSR